MSSQAPIRILSIAHTAVSRAAGRLRYYPLATRQDIDVHLVVPSIWSEFGRTIVADPPDDPGLNVHVLPIWFRSAGPMNWYLHFYSGLRALINRIEPQVIHLWEEPWSLVALQACLLKGNASLVLEVDQNILKRLPPPFEAIRAHVLRRTDYVLSRSAAAAAVVRARGYRGPIGEIGYGVDMDTFRPRDESTGDRAGGQELKIGYVGRIVVEKGLDDLIDAMTLARSQVSLAIMGHGPHESSLRKRIKECGLEERVKFRTWGPPSEVAEFIRDLDALVLLTRSSGTVVEQFGRVIVEAQSCGVPVLGSTCGAIPEVIGDGGWVVPERDPDALAKVLDMIAADPDSRRARGRSAMQNVSKRFTYDVVADVLAKAWMHPLTKQPAR